MPSAPHAEKHVTTYETVRDVVKGMADGLTGPFAPAIARSYVVGGFIPLSSHVFFGQIMTMLYVSFGATLTARRRFSW